jgi:hypothetical protein
MGTPETTEIDQKQDKIDFQLKIGAQNIVVGSNTPVCLV